MRGPAKRPSSSKMSSAVGEGAMSSSSSIIMSSSKSSAIVFGIVKTRRRCVLLAVEHHRFCLAFVSAATGVVVCSYCRLFPVSKLSMLVLCEWLLLPSMLDIVVCGCESVSCCWGGGSGGAKKLRLHETPPSLLPFAIHRPPWDCSFSTLGVWTKRVEEKE
jgi:hypothetical protein